MGNKVRIASASIIAALALGFTGCATQPESDTAPAPETTMSTDDAAQAAAASIDSVFADEATWEAAKETAQAMCDMADVDPDGAFETSLVLGAEAGVSAEQIGIIWGVAVNLYCPEHEGVTE